MSKRFIRRGVAKIKFSPTMPANLASPTRAELDAATDLSDEVAEAAGWAVENQKIDTPDLGSEFTSSIPGQDQAADSSLTFYEDFDSETIETILPKGQSGVVYIMRKGDKPGSASLDVFPTRVASRPSEITLGNEAARFRSQFTITGKPELDVVIPASA